MDKKSRWVYIPKEPPRKVLLGGAMHRRNGLHRMLAESNQLLDWMMNKVLWSTRLDDPASPTIVHVSVSACMGNVCCVFSMSSRLFHLSLSPSLPVSCRVNMHLSRDSTPTGRLAGASAAVVEFERCDTSSGKRYIVVAGFFVCLWSLPLLTFISPSLTSYRFTLVESQRSKACFATLGQAQS
jgi:hypothetical protein